MTRILVVDDETALVELVRSYLEREQYEVLTAVDGHVALDLARAAQPDLVVLDVMLPMLDGLEVCRQLRQFSDAYVIMLTARAEEIDTILGLTVGADDYLTKPFSPRELVARIAAVLRRTHSAPPQVGDIVRVGGLRTAALRPRPSSSRPSAKRRRGTPSSWARPCACSYSRVSTQGPAGPGEQFRRASGM